jgi:hypothetical protein
MTHCSRLKTYAGKFKEEYVFSYDPSRLSMAVITTNPTMPHTVVLAKDGNHDYIGASDNEFNRAQI